MRDEIANCSSFLLAVMCYQLLYYVYDIIIILVSLISLSVHLVIGNLIPNVNSEQSYAGTPD